MMRSNADAACFVHPSSGFGIGASLAPVIEQGRKFELFTRLPEK
jgi:hypothetical protein